MDAYPELFLEYALVGCSARHLIRSKSGRIAIDTTSPAGGYRPILWFAVRHEFEPDAGEFEYRCVCATGAGQVAYSSSAGHPCPYFAVGHSGIRAISLFLTGQLSSEHSLSYSGLVASVQDPHLTEQTPVVSAGEYCGVRQAHKDAFLARFEITLGSWRFSR